MELEHEEPRELCEDPEAPELLDGAEERGMEIQRAAKPERLKIVAPLILSTLVLAAGIAVFRWTGWEFTTGSPDACRPGAEAYYSICYSPFGRLLFGPGLFLAATAAAGVEGVRGRHYRRWLLLSSVLVAVPIVAKFLEAWVVVGGR